MTDLRPGSGKKSGDSSSLRAFAQHRRNGVYLRFPNGNAMSTIWGLYTYSDNHDFDPDTGNIEEGADRVLRRFDERLDSNTCEVMVYCDDRLLKRLEKKFEAEQPFGYLSMGDWLYLVKTLSREKKDNTPPHG